MSKKHRDPFSRLNKGAGQGIGAAYVSPINMRDFSSRGQCARVGGSTVHREYQLFSQGESNLFTMLDFFPDFVDIREQFIHQPVEDTVALCSELRIKHPKMRGKLFPVSTDFVVTRRNGRYVAFEVKSRPESMLSRRERQMIEVRRVWWSARRVPFHLVESEQLDQAAIRNLRMIRYRNWDYLRQADRYELARFSATFQQINRRDVPLEIMLSMVASELGVPMDQEALVRTFCAAVQQHHLFVDLRQDIGLSRPVRLVRSVNAMAAWPW